MEIRFSIVAQVKNNHMSMRLYLLSFSILLTISSIRAQEDLAIGDWRSHLPYRFGPYVTQSDDAVYYATAWSILQLDKAELAPRFISKTNGLSGVGVSLIKYNRQSDILIVVYDDSSLDLVYFQEGVPGRIITMNQIKNFKNIGGDKLIYDIYIENDSIAYLAANYGVSKVNLFASEFSFTTFTGIETLSVQIFENQIYLATPEGLYRTSKDNINPDDFGSWEWLGPEAGFPGDYSSRRLVSYQNHLYFDVDNELYRLEEGLPKTIHAEPGYNIQFLTAEGEYLLAGFRCVSGCFRGRTYYLTPGGQEGFIAEDCFGIPNYAVEDEQGRIWIADLFSPFRMINDVKDANCIFRTFNSPPSENNREIAIHNDQVWIAAGGVNQNFSNRFSDQGFYSLIDGQWTLYNRNTHQAIKGEDLENTPLGRSDDLLDFIAIAVHPANGKIYAGSFYEGLAELDGENMVFFNDKNSSLQNAVGDPLRTRVSGLVFDQENNLWITNHSAPEPLSVLKTDGSWQSFNLPCTPNELHQIDIDQNGYKWAVTSNSQAGVVLFDSGDLNDPGDDRCRLFTANNSNLPTNNANCLSVDLDGDVWVGTSEGIVIFECGASAFDPGCQGSRRIVEQDGFGAYLLDTEDIQTIAVDGANRKWIGSRNGVFVLSPTGEEQVARFTEDNSPLFDNNIIDIAINSNNGEVFIGANKGVISYRSDALPGGRVNTSNIVVFPNPVRPEYDGPIAIKGLARDANVKITDVGGKLVFETKALGGQAIWYARDYNGKRVQSGVYLVFSASSSRFTGFDKPDAAVTKILVVN